MHANTISVKLLTDCLMYCIFDNGEEYRSFNEDIKKIVSDCNCVYSVREETQFFKSIIRPKSYQRKFNRVSPFIFISDASQILTKKTKLINLIKIAYFDLFYRSIKLILHTRLKLYLIQFCIFVIKHSVVPE